ncbi:unnamed protein product [Ilex paraguariensis]|uniref:BHLH domain-containing protein n=1 Tax=Ilex paraguariensis TaxID=185542 RepID=A0ABC8R5S6_9AQUA
MYSSASIPRDRTSSSLLFSSSGFKHSFVEEESLKSKELISCDLYHGDYQKQQQSSELMWCRSDPSSFFAEILGNGSGSDYFNPQSVTSPESGSDSVFATPPINLDSNLNLSKSMINQQVNKLSDSQLNNGFSSSASEMIYETNPPPPPLPAVSSASAADVGSYSAVKMESPIELRTPNANCSNLIRQSSSPAEFFSGFSVTGASNGTYGETSCSTVRLNNRNNFSSGPSSCSRFMHQIAGNVNESIGTGSHENGHLRSGTNTDGCYAPSILTDSWNDSTFKSLKRNRDGDVKMFPSLNSLEFENVNSRNNNPGLTHHLSLPKTSAEMAAIEKFLQFQQDSIPCKIRAKRGFATHPRSIAERMRRTRISERMRKLQDLFPNMDKQTNTADMLDMAVEYIKDLQKQVQTLTDTQTKCVCSSKQK